MTADRVVHSCFSRKLAPGTQQALFVIVHVHVLFMFMFMFMFVFMFVFMFMFMFMFTMFMLWHVHAHCATTVPSSANIPLVIPYAKHP